jgi:tetratricopeptide (TPR) repeat protein
MGLPPSVPAPKASAHARATALRVSLSKEPDPKLRAAVAFELGALTELRLEDRTAALDIYREARQLDPQFRPALFALARMLADARELDELATTLAATVSASALPSEKSSALVTLGCLFEDKLGDAAAAANSFERALEADPSCLAAALMLERALRAIGRSDAADSVLATRTAHSFDPNLRSVLATETARAQATRGEVGDAIETLLAAVAVRGRRFSTLLALADLATEQHQSATAARAFEDAATLLAAHAAGQRGPDADDIAARFPDPAAAMTAAAWLYRRAGRHFLASEDCAADAQRVFERASAGQRHELVLHMERADACQVTGEFDGARTSLEALLEHAPPPRAAALQFRLADLAQHVGDRDETASHLEAGLRLDPESPVLRAALEDTLIDNGALPQLAAALSARAEQSSGEDAKVAFMRAAAVAETMGDLPRAVAAMRRAAESADGDPMLLRELLGVALRAGDRAAVRSVCERLLRCELSGAERSALCRTRYDACLAEGDYPRALEALREALEDPTCDDWAGHNAWVLAALRGDYALLAAAHEALAEQAGEPDLAAAHVAAAGRAYLRSGASERALPAFRRVLELSPTDAYAVAALEGLLVARNEAGEALRLLRDTAAAERDHQRAELALLHAGAAAEQAGRADLAVRSYEDAADKNPDSLSANWARLRLSERTHDLTLGTRALRALAERESRLSQPGIAQLELAERLDVLGEWSQALHALGEAFSGEHVTYEAAASALLAPRGPEGIDPRALRVLALGKVAQHATPALRPSIEHEQVAELLYDAPADARTLLIARTEYAPLGFGDELLAFLLSDDAATRSRTLANLARLDPEPATRAELALHALRTQTLHDVARNEDALVSALALIEEAPESLAAAVALSEALTDQDSADLRASALTARARHTPSAGASGLRREMLRAYLEADRASDALALARELIEEDALDLGAWDAQREAARRTGDWKLLVAACDELAKHASGVHRARLLEDAAAALHEELSDPAGAEARLREALLADPSRSSLFERLHDLLLEQGDLEGLAATLTARIAVSDSAEEKLDLSYAKARILRALGRRQAALDCVRDVLASDPLHAGALSLSAEIHASEQAWDAAVLALDALAKSDVPPAQRRLAREGAADFLEHKLKDPAAAHARLAALASEGHADLAVFTRMADIAMRAGLAEESAAALAQAAAHSSGPNRAAFERRAAIVYAQSLNRPADAREALRRALAADPLDIDALEALYATADPHEPELTSSEMFLHELWSALRAEPSDSRLLRSLARCGRLRSDKMLEYLALASLSALGLAHGDELAALATAREVMPALPTGAISDVQFALLGGPTHAHAAFRVARIVCRAGLDIAAMKPDTGKRTRLSEATEFFRAIARIAGVFGLTLTELHQNDSVGRDVVVWSRGPGQVAISVGHELNLPLTEPVKFALGSQCAALRLGVLPLIQAERGVARDLLYAALCMFPTAPQPTDAVRLRPLATELSRKLSRKERRELETVVGELPEPLQALQEVGEDARAGAYRAGILVARDLEPALRHVFGDNYSVDQLVNSKLGLRLLRFWTSQTCLALLRGLGMAS